jgi:hypothetical protein
MDKKQELSYLDKWDLEELITEKIRYYEKLGQEWSGDDDDDFSMEQHCHMQMARLTKLKQKIKYQRII